MNILFALAIAMAVGMAMTRLIKLIHLPNVTAYLIAGLLVGPYVLKVLTPEMNSKLSIISDVALGFIAYSIGSEFKFSYIKEIGAKPMVITAFEGCVASLLVFLTLLALGQPLPMCLALGAIAAATAPAATLMVVRQYKANGPVTRMLLPVVAMDDALGLMLYAIMMAIARTLDSGAALSVMTLLVKPLIEIVGSLAMGVLIGTVMVFCLRFFHSRGNKLTMTILIVFLAVGLSTMLDLSSLLVCMMIGATMINVSNDFYIFDFLSGHLQGIHQSGTGDDSRSVLVVVHDGNVQFFFQAAFDFETFGSFDVFQVDAAESRSDSFHCCNEFFRIFLIHFNIEHVDTCINFEKQSFTFHYGFAAQCAYVTQSEHSCTIGDNGNKIAFSCIFIRILRILLYFKTRLCHTGRVCK